MNQRALHRRWLPMPGNEGGSPGTTALWKLPVGNRFHSLSLAYTGVTLAEMTEIRIKLNGLVIQRFSGTERDLLNQFLGLKAAGGILRIPFDRIGLKNRDQEELTAINTNVADAQGNKISAFTVEVDVDAGATAPAFELDAEQSDSIELNLDGSKAGPGLIPYLIKGNRSPSGSGEFEIGDFNYGRSDSLSLNRITFLPSANNIEQVEVMANNERIFKRKAAINTRIQEDGDAGRVPQSGAWVIDTTENGYGAATIPLVGLSDFRYRLWVDGAMTITALQEYNGVLPR
ncbi:major capsid protein P2 [uncultured Microbulbifer sp.]|uniref:major capsid protein P2 n=1 Tax=uncultured Microbulbifer sp. TaxID=348147 RepID=UPI002628AEB4|nr:major capsid protein P2 [uncultured Microbulbifer sp.]